MRERELRGIDEGGMKSFGALNDREGTMAILGHRWCPQAAKQGGDKGIMWCSFRVFSLPTSSLPWMESVV